MNVHLNKKCVVIDFVLAGTRGEEERREAGRRYCWLKVVG